MNTYSIYIIYYMYIYIYIYINTDTYIYTWQTVASSMPSKSIKLCNKVKKGLEARLSLGTQFSKSVGSRGITSAVSKHLVSSCIFSWPFFLLPCLSKSLNWSDHPLVNLLTPNLSPTLRSGHNRYWPWLLHHRWWHYLAYSAVKKTRRMKHYTAPMRANQRKR